MISDTLDRSAPPVIRRVDKLNIEPAQKFSFANGIPVYVLNQGTQDVCSISFNFRAGKWHQPQRLISRLTNKMMREGTESYSSKEIAEKLDFYGAQVRLQSGTDRSTVSLSALNKHLDGVLPIFYEILMKPTFPEAELEIALTRGLERLKIDKTKHDYLAGRKLATVVFGEEHPYGTESRVEDYAKVEPQLLRNFHINYYNASNCFLVVAGKVPKDTIGLLEKYFGGKDWVRSSPADVVQQLSSSPQLKHRIKMEKSVQSALRIGRRLFNKTHADFQKMQVLNTLLGGYFGSRLMSNIREDKGYTYGIHSGLSSMIHHGYFYVGTEVGYDVTDAALGEIYKEINRLREELVPVDELELIRNYMSGKILSGLDGPFRLADYYCGLIIYGLDIDYAHELLNTVKTVTAKDLQELANKYLNTEEMHEVVVG